jgi:hypothetical protein
MTTRKLTEEQRVKANTLLATIRTTIDGLSEGDESLRFAYNRKVAKELQYDERGTPMERRALKREKFGEQHGLCAQCTKPLEPGGRNAELDRLEAMDGYTATNTRLVHHECHRAAQEERGFTG